MSTISSRQILARRIAAACGTGVLLLGATACGSDGNDATNQSAPTSTQGAPGANGKVAAVSGSTAQVQSQQSGQVAVTWNATTTFTRQLTATLADVSVGDCVMVTPVEDADDSADTTTQPTAVTAASVRITAPTNGSCSPGGGQGGPAGGAAGDGPPDGAPDGARPQVRGFGGAFGTVKAVSATGFTVTAAAPPTDSSTTTSTVEVTVTVAKATTYSTTATGAATDVKVGVCVRADGKTDDTGAITATRIAVTPAVEGECTGGMVRFSRNGSADTGGQAS